MPDLPLPEAAPEDLRAANAQLREALEARDAQLSARDAELEAARARIAVLAGRVEELERRLGKDSSNSSKPPSSDSPYTKKPRDRSLRGRSGRGRGKQPGAPSSTLKQSADPDERVACGPAACGCCGAGLDDAAVAGVQKRQVFEAQPPPPPKVTEYQVVAKACPGCGTVTEGVAPAGVTGRVQYAPLAHAQAALAVCAHYLPVARAARLLATLTGVSVSAGLGAGVRARAAARLGPFLDPGPGAAARGRGAVCRPDPRPRRRAPALRARGLRRVPHRDAHRRPVRRGYRRRRRAPRIHWHDRPRRLRRVPAPGRRAARLVRRARPA